MRNKKNVWTVTVPKVIPVHVDKGDKPTVDAATASKMLDAIRLHESAAQESRRAAMVAVYGVYSTRAWLADPRYKAEGDAGFIHAVSDAMFKPQGPRETAEQYKDRWEGARSRIYQMKSAGFLLSFLDSAGWPIEACPRYDHLAIIGQIVTSAAMKGDPQLIASTAAGLIEAVMSGENDMRNPSTLRRAVQNIINPPTENEGEEEETMTMVMTLKVPKGTPADRIKSAKKAGLAAARKALKG